MTPLQSIRALIDAALAGTKVVACPRCGGWGTVGLHTMPATCPECHGKGRVVTNERESDDTTQRD